MTLEITPKQDVVSILQYSNALEMPVSFSEKR